MNKLSTEGFFDARATEDGGMAVSPEDMVKLRFLLNAVDIDASGARLALQVGKARVTLHENGTIRLDGAAVVQTATESITLDGALIELN
ncbi:hypothetical protein BC777_3899 [Yoonia maricola]|uniref:Uncharacterized protein n=1 Tax=Yoonia maricola TaxID=420999 RepID=A0A2M8W0B0_9RHOB|nr:hypothetical protein [Yoonia maricola]PJI84357.1 hypothetical protein BC777_3899 [Yoonia maricola]